jgi:hypothetical protein
MLGRESLRYQIQTDEAHLTYYRYKTGIMKYLPENKHKTFEMYDWYSNSPGADVKNIHEALTPFLRRHQGVVI